MENNLAELIRLDEQRQLAEPTISLKLKEKIKQSERLFDLLKGVDFFYDDLGIEYATIGISDSEFTVQIASKEFRLWLLRGYFKQYGGTPTKNQLNEVIENTMALARFSGKNGKVFLRVGKLNEKIYLDLGDPTYQVIEVDRVGWRILKRSPIKFIRTKGMQALQKPVNSNSGESIDLLRNFLNVSSEDDFKLAVAWLLRSLSPDGPYLVLILIGEQGSAKSSFLKTLRTILDPHTLLLRKEPTQANDVPIGAKNNWILAYDNISHISNSTSDDLCRISTGGGFATRELYTNDSEIIVSVTRPIAINGISASATRGDLLSRSIILYLPPIEEHKRLKEKELKAKLDQSAPVILGALLSAVARGLRDTESFSLGGHPRMADAWHWISSCEVELNWKRGSSLEAFRLNQNKADHLVLSNSPIYQYLSDLAINGWTGTMTELHNRIGSLSKNDNQCLPKNPRALGDEIRRLRPALKSVRIEVTERQTAGSNSRVEWMIKKH